NLPKPLPSSSNHSQTQDLILQALKQEAQTTKIKHNLTFHDDSFLKVRNIMPCIQVFIVGADRRLTHDYFDVLQPRPESGHQPFHPGHSQCEVATAATAKSSPILLRRISRCHFNETTHATFLSIVVPQNILPSNVPIGLGYGFLRRVQIDTGRLQ